MSLRVHELGALPWVQLFVSSRCNLRCPYCSNHRSHPERRGRFADAREDFLSDPQLADLIESTPTTHFYISGGEPLIHPGIRDFVTRLGRNGHVVSFDTNVALPIPRLRELFAAWDREWLGFVNISHHLDAGIRLDYVLERCRLLRDLGLPQFVKYVGVPERLGDIRRHMDALRAEGIGAAVTILTGSWKGRELPGDYALRECLDLLELVTLHTHGLQLFEGVHSRGRLCRGGQDFIAWNALDGAEVLPCCHGSKHPTQLGQTFFKTGRRPPIPCRVDTCMGDLMFVYGINGVLDERERFEALCTGAVDCLGASSVVEFVRQIVERGARLVNAAKYTEVEQALHMTAAR